MASTSMTPEEIKQAIAQAHYDAYTAAINAGKTPEQAMQIADAAADAKRHELTQKDHSAELMTS